MAETQPSHGASNVQPNPVEGLVQFVRDSYAELHRVQWPNRETVIKHTIVVVSLLIFMSAYIGALDAFWTWVFNHFLHIGSEYAGS